jgi:hypothetical protein
MALALNATQSVDMAAMEAWIEAVEASHSIIDTSLSLTMAAAAEAADLRALEESKARFERLRVLRNSYTELLLSNLANRIILKQGWVVIERAYPPIKKMVGDKRVPKYRPEETYWSGLDDSGSPIDPSTNGVPKVMLLQGPRSLVPDERGFRPVNPKELPDEVTSPQQLQQMLDESHPGYEVQVHFIKGMVTVVVVWDHRAWQMHLSGNK